MDTSVITVGVLLATVGLRVMLVTGAAWLLVRRRQTCPHCGGDTLPLAGIGMLSRLALERRFCPCGWQGLCRRLRETGGCPGRRVAGPAGLEDALRPGASS